jgi:hypothetical protein
MPNLRVVRPTLAGIVSPVPAAGDLFGRGLGHLRLHNRAIRSRFLCRQQPITGNALESLLPRRIRGRSPTNFISLVQ